jgi:aspartyl-tRNA(Asn)/glutamyl-tRNA(Gln) amidotransferase subunit C
VITLEEVRHVARLAHLALTAEEEERYRAQLSSILEYVEQLKTLDTSQVEPLTHAASPNPGGALREDRAAPSLSVDDVLHGAPERSGDSFAVPKIIE